MKEKGLVLGLGAVVALSTVSLAAAMDVPLLGYVSGVAGAVFPTVLVYAVLSSDSDAATA